MRKIYPVILMSMLAGCSSGSGGRALGDAAVLSDGESERSDGGTEDGGSNDRTNPNGNNAKPGQDGAIAVEGDAEVDPTEDGDAGPLPGEDAGAVACLSEVSDAWIADKFGPCCFGKNKIYSDGNGGVTIHEIPAPEKPFELFINGQASGKFDVDFSAGYNYGKITYSGVKPLAFVRLTLLAAPPYDNADYVKSLLRVEDEESIPVEVEPLHYCDATLPPGKVLHFTYTVEYRDK